MQRVGTPDTFWISQPCVAGDAGRLMSKTSARHCRPIKLFALCNDSIFSLGGRPAASRLGPHSAQLDDNSFVTREAVLAMVEFPHSRRQVLKFRHHDILHSTRS